MPNQIFEWVGPRQCFCTQCHYDNATSWEHPHAWSIEDSTLYSSVGMYIYIIAFCRRMMSAHYTLLLVVETLR